MARIGFIGLGNMGLPMAGNLVKAGHQVLGFDLVTSNVEKAVARKVEKANGAVEVAKDDFGAIRTGRANPAMFAKITVDYYGAPTPLQQLAATVSDREATVARTRKTKASSSTPSEIATTRRAVPIRIDRSASAP